MRLRIDFVRTVGGYSFRIFFFQLEIDEISVSFCRPVSQKLFPGTGSEKPGVLRPVPDDLQGASWLVKFVSTNFSNIRVKHFLQLTSIPMNR